MRKLTLTALILFILCAAAASSLAQVQSSVWQGRILSVEELGVQAEDELYWEHQLVTVELLSGSEQGQTVQIRHTLTGHPHFDLRVKRGDRVVVQNVDGDYVLADFSRQRPLLFITVLFILSVIVIGRGQGVKAIVSLAGMGVIIFAIILPLILKGFNPILVTVGLSSLLTVFFVLFVTGRSRKTAAAICGTVGGLVVAGLLAFAVGRASFLTGLSSGEAQILHYMDSSIDFQGILFSGMIIGALGAILDVGISIASAMEQIKEADPSTDLATLFKRGIAVGRDLIATMSNTLILAYVGSSLPLLLLFQASDSSWSEVLNLDLVAAEVVRSMAGSIGLTLAIPITALVSAFLFVQPQHKAEHLGS